MRQPYDLAAAKAALLMLQDGVDADEVFISLPDPPIYLAVPVESVAWLDADNTDSATIFAEVKRNSSGTLRFQAVPGVAADLGHPPALVVQIKQANTVENVVQIMESQPDPRGYWMEIERRTSAQMATKVPSGRQVALWLFSMDGTPLGEAA